MRSSLLACTIILASSLISQRTLAQGGAAGVCDRDTGQAIAFIDNQRQIWLAAINKNNLPEDVKNAYIIIVNHAHDTAVGGAKLKNMDCTKKYEGDQAIMNVAVTIFSQGLSLLAPGKTAYIDVSEIEHGYPLGGPDALIPKLREQILGGDNGTVSNIIRDPIQCLTFAHKC
jgi:hypothetical protein